MEKELDKYAEVLVKTGVNIQKKQILALTAPIEAADFARRVSQKAYEAGAGEVRIFWTDDRSSKIGYQMAPGDIFDKVPSWIGEFYNGYARVNAAFLYIISPDSDLMKDVDSNLIRRYTMASSEALKESSERKQSNQNTWCVAAHPNDSWARKVFPSLPLKEGVEKLWKMIFKTVRIDQDDPVEAWRIHLNLMEKRKAFLNGQGFKFLHYKNSKGTDLSVELIHDHIWIGGSVKSREGHDFMPNLPTEEIFTCPKRDGVNGTLISSRPLSLMGKVIEDFTFTFKDGLVTEYEAKTGKEALDELFQVDEGARRLGEAALIPHDSVISNLNIVFFNTLFDENSSCHFALGKSYPISYKGGTDMSREERIKAGANDSKIHVDFMMGTEDLCITGEREDGSLITFFEGGNFSDILNGSN